MRGRTEVFSIQHSVFRVQSSWLCLQVVAIALLLPLTGCGKKASVKSQLGELEKAFPAASAPAVSSVQDQTATSIQTSPPAESNAYVRLALSAVRSNDYAAGVIALE